MAIHAWPILLEEMGALHLEPPLSGTMQRLVADKPTQTLMTTDGLRVALYVPASPCATSETSEALTTTAGDAYA